jgi:hyperosmotically inducible protein
MPLQNQFNPGTSRTNIRRVIGIGLLATLPILMACESADSTKTVGQKLDIAVAKTEQTAIEVKDATKASIESASATLREGAAQAKVAAQTATNGINFDAQDASITASVSAGLIKDPDLSAIKIDVDTKNGVVTLYGPAPSQAALDRATVIAKTVKGVSSVDNKLTVKTS